MRSELEVVLADDVVVDGAGSPRRFSRGVHQMLVGGDTVVRNGESGRSVSGR